MRQLLQIYTRNIFHLLINNDSEDKDRQQDRNFVKRCGQITTYNDWPQSLVAPILRYQPTQKDASDEMKEYLKHISLRKV